MENQLRSHGFTLVELIVVMVVLGILAAVFIPRSNNPAIIVSTQAEQLAADIRYVQSLSMTDGWNGVLQRRYRINFTATTYNFIARTYNFPLPGFTDVAVPHSSGTTTPILFAGGVSISMPSLPNSLVSFDGLGRPYTDATTDVTIPGTPITPPMAIVTLASGGATRAVQIFPETGMVRVP